MKAATKNKAPGPDEIVIGVDRLKISRSGLLKTICNSSEILMINIHALPGEKKSSANKGKKKKEILKESRLMNPTTKLLGF